MSVTRNEVEATLNNLGPQTFWMRPLLESWLSQRALLEEVAKEECRAKGHDSVCPEDNCLPCRARALVAG